MSAGRANLTMPILAVVAFAAILGWFVYARLGSQPAPVAPSPAGTAGSSAPASAPEIERTARANPDPALGPPAATVPAAAPPAPSPQPSPTPRVGVEQANRPAETTDPAFDIVRVERSGESVIAGRAAPGATVELLSNGVPIARAVADEAGQFAFVPPILTPGSHEIALQVERAPGFKTRSEQSVTVVIAAGGKEAPLVALTRPGQPTTILSQPEEGPRVASAPAASQPGTGLNPGAVARPSADSGSRPATKPSAFAARPDVRIAAVEAEGSGRLYVSGLAAPGATLRLYLNDAFVAPGATAADGRLAFTIERGVRPGDYRVRLDDIDPASGAVRSRAEVPFNVPVLPVAPPLPPVAERPGAPLIPALPGSAAGAATAVPAPPGASSLPGASLVENARSATAAAGSSVSAIVVGGAPPLSSAMAAPPPPASSSEAVPASRAAAASSEVVDAPAKTDPVVVVPEVTTATVARGDNLWRISKRTYGRGLRYTVIFGANTPQIRNPNLIYPGQIFVLPNDRAGAVLR